MIWPYIYIYKMTPVVQVQENLKILPQALNFTVCKGATSFLVSPGGCVDYCLITAYVSTGKVQQHDLMAWKEG